MFSTLLSGKKLAGALTIGVISVTGLATAAYACVLPNSIQSFAHNTIGAPAPTVASVAAIEAAVQAANLVTADPSASPSATPTLAASPSATPTKAVTTQKLALTPRAILAYRLCGELAAKTKAGKTLDAADLAALTKLAGSSAAITAYCAALPVIPLPVCVTPTVSPSASPSATPAVNAPKVLREWCEVCPELSPTATATPTVSPTATPATIANKDRDNDKNKFCAAFLLGNHGKDGKDSKDGKTGHVADPSMTPKPRPSMFSQNPLTWLDRNNSSGAGSHNIVPLGGDNKNAQQGQAANGPRGAHGR
jgi:hypothetical protein